MKKLVLLPCPRAVLEHCGARAGLWTRKRKLHCPGQAEQRCHRGGGEHQVRAERDWRWRWRWRPAERQHGSGWPDQQRPSGRVIPRPGRRRSAGAIYGPRSGDHQHIDSTSAQPDLCPVPRCDDRKWRSSVAHRTSALTISTFATGASLGSTNSVPFRFWIVAFDNASTVVLGLITCSAPTQVFPLDETAIQRSVAMTAGATSTGVFYTPNGTTVTSKAYRILGYLEYASGLATAGTYATAPTKVQLFGPGVKKPGAIVQTAYASNTGSTTATTNSARADRNDQDDHPDQHHKPDPGDGIRDAQREHRGPTRDRTAVPRHRTDADRIADGMLQHGAGERGHLHVECSSNGGGNCIWNANAAVTPQATIPIHEIQ
jgi:hypothetical protein